VASAAGLSDINRFVIAGDVIDRTLDVVQDAGRTGYEAFVLWGGVRSDTPGELLLVSVYQPRQRGITTEDGLLVVVDGEALHRANEAFYERGEVIAAQAHSHPTDAFHSDTDDTYPLMTLQGGLSVVVQFFGHGGREAIGEWAWFRLVDVATWAPLDHTTKVVIAG
jgi:hypothetical protein